LPRGTGWWLNAIARSNISSTVSTRITPHWRSSASVAASVPASAPVWDEAARAPARDRPDFTAMMGFFRVISRASCVKRRGFPKFSRYIRITPVRSSSAQYWIRSLPLTSGLLPTETNCEMPMPYSAA
jgi:hypothetical protein